MMTRGTRVRKTGKVKLKRAAPAKRAARVPRTVRDGGLDPAAKAHLALLGDPCNAALTTGLYPGVAGTQVLRTRDNINPGGSVVDGVLYFDPSHMVNVGCPYFYASVNTTATAPATVYGATNGVFTSGLYARVRCLAACIKLRFTGTTLNRGGTVSRTLVEDNPLANGTPAGVATGGALPNVLRLTQSWPTVNTMADGTSFEVRWLPGQSDTLWLEVPANEVVEPQPNASTGSGNACALAFVGVAAGSCYWEVTAAWEVIPASVVTGSLGNSLVATVAAPKSRNTVNDILRTIGDISKWATSPEVSGAVRYAGSKLAQYAPAVMSLAL